MVRVLAERLGSDSGGAGVTYEEFIGSELYGALINNRFAIGSELKPSYWRQGVKNLEDGLENPPMEQMDLLSEIKDNEVLE